MSLLQFIKTKRAWKNLGFIFLVYVGLTLFSWFCLFWYTDHGTFVTVPELKGKSIAEAKLLLEELDLEAVVVDSVWSDTAALGSIRDNNPESGSTIKSGREIYLTVFRSTPPMEIINIKSGEYAEVAKIKLATKGIKYEVEIQPNNNFISSVIAIRWNGKSVALNDLIPRGSYVKLIIGEADKTTIQVPDLFGLTPSEARDVLHGMNLQVQMFFDEAPQGDSAAYKVCRQEPPYSPITIPVNSGSIIDVYLSKTPCERDSTLLQFETP